MSTIFYKEIKSFFCSAAAYCIVGFFVVSVWMILWILPDDNLLSEGYASLDKFFSICPYLFAFLIPAITMQSFADERRAGTLDLLFSMQISRLEIFLGKYFAYLGIVFIMLLLSTINYFMLWGLSIPIGNIDTSTVIGSYFGLLFIAAIFASLGIFASIFTNKQVVAFVIGAALCIVLYQGFSSLGMIINWSKYSLFISGIGLKYHYEELSKGVVDSRNVVYLAVVLYGIIFTSKKILDRL